MTLGERLQQLRKEKHMSQEELGKLLLVSRQTESLWENNQTIPSVDNLIRLKEIFGVSIDSILTHEETKISEPLRHNQTDETTTDCYESLIERHFFCLNKNELKYIYKIFTMPLLKKLLLCVFLLFYSIYVSLSDIYGEQNFYFLFLLGLIFFCVNLIKYIQGLLSTKKSVELVCSRRYTYEIFRDYIIVRVASADDEIKTQKIFFNELTKCWETPFCYFLEIKDGTNFIIKKSSLGEASQLGWVCQNLKSQKTDLSSRKIVFLKTMGNILLVSCFIGLFTAIMISVDMISQNEETSYESMEALRIFHYFLPIPLLSIISGILLNKNKIRNKKNIICGVIIGLIMLIYGFFPTIFGNIGNNLEYLEAQLGFEFPQTVGMHYKSTSDISGGKQTLTTLNFEESVANNFEEFMQDDHRWIKGSNKVFTKIIPEILVNYPTDYFLIYNTVTSEFGKIPDNEGQYQLIYIAYSTEMNVAYIYEYLCVI